MNRASKILTVSYGTFSCTLEGFDDTLGTMKAIAEYFRDLSAKDRYFGAEPPALDPEVLANIASRKTSLHVEAKVNDNGVHLTPCKAPPAAPEPQAAEMAEMPAIAPAKDIPEQTKLKKAHDNLVVPSSEYDDAQDEALVETAPAYENPVLKQDASKPGVESIAAKLRRIRAVVAAKQGSSSTSSIFAEDFQPDPETGQKDSATDKEDEPAGEDSQTPPAIEPAGPAQDMDTAKETSPSKPEEDEMKIALPEAGFSMEDDYDDFEQDDDEMSVALMLDVVEDAEEDLEEKSVSGTEPNETKQDAGSQDDILTEPEKKTPVVQPVRPARPKPADTQRPKPHSSDTESRRETRGKTSNVIETASDPNAIRSAVKSILGKTSLSDNDESELLTQLANIEVEEATSPASPSLDRGIDAALRADRANRVMNEEGGAENEVALDRLLEETNAKLDTSESHRRRSTISHLRAAVAATFADRKLDLGDEAGNGDGVEPYRSALADVVQPKTANSYAEPDNSGVAPLVLATDQRVDIENRAKDGLSIVNTPTGGPDELIADNTSFGDFARKVGATDLPDLMEAAAAYAAYIEGSPYFARPQIMRLVAGFTGKEEFNREEGLRAFGQLLRQGKIVKIRRGQFGIADNTRFKPTTPMAGE